MDKTIPMDAALPPTHGTFLGQPKGVAYLSMTAAALEREIHDLVEKYTQRGTVFDAEIARLRQAQFVPGKMHCAKCKFTLNRVTLNARTGGVMATPGNEPEACPNGCGPLWPVTWEQEARECWAHIDTLADQLFPKDSHG